MENLNKRLKKKILKTEQNIIDEKMTEKIVFVIFFSRKHAKT